MVWIFNARIFAAFAVIILHTAASYLIHPEIGSLNWWIVNIYDSSARWAVPVFVMISGALLLDNSKNDTINDFYIKRASKIIIPFITWNSIYFFLTYIKRTLTHTSFTLDEFLKKLAHGESHYHMWYLYMIIPMYIVTPFLKKITNQSEKNELIFFVVIAFIFSLLNAPSVNTDTQLIVTFSTEFLRFIPYFCMGNIIMKNYLSIKGNLLFAILLGSIITTAIGEYLISVNFELFNKDYFYDCLSISVIPMSIAGLLLLKKTSKPILGDKVTRATSDATFGIYLIHPVFLDALLSINKIKVLIPPIAYIPMVSCLVFIMSCTTILLMRKIPYLKMTV